MKIRLIPALLALSLTLVVSVIDAKAGDAKAAADCQSEARYPEISKKELFENLNIAIHQFAKKQMTWFRRMEKNGANIHWLDALAPLEENLEKIDQLFYH